MIEQMQFTTLQWFLTIVCWIYGILHAYLLFCVVTSSQEMIKENQRLLESIEDKIAFGWISKEDPYLIKIMKFLQKFDGFSANDYFTLNKSLLIGMLANFVTYFIILVQFSYI